MTSTGRSTLLANSYKRLPQQPPYLFAWITRAIVWASHPVTTGLMTYDNMQQSVFLLKALRTSQGWNDSHLKQEGSLDLRLAHLAMDRRLTDTEVWWVKRAIFRGWCGSSWFLPAACIEKKQKQEGQLWISHVQMLLTFCQFLLCDDFCFDILFIAQSKVKKWEFSHKQNSSCSTTLAADKQRTVSLVTAGLENALMQRMQDVVQVRSEDKSRIYLISVFPLFAWTQR